MSAEHPGGTPGSGGMSDRMRALLSRAAEEQLHEQRQVSTVLGELRSLVEDVDERLATGEQVERLGAQVHALAERVEARLDAAEARSAELAERISSATELVGRAAQDLVGAVAAGVAERVEAQLREVTADLAATVGEVVVSSERRLAVHVDDAVLALAEVVLRRRRPLAPAALAPEPAAVAVSPPPVDEDEPGPAAGEPAAEPTPDVASGAPAVEDPPVEAGEEVDALPDVPPREAGAEVAGAGVADAPDPGEDPTPEGPAPEDPTPEDPTPEDPAPEDPAAEDEPLAPEGFVLVPADVEQPEAGPAAPVQQERRTAERRTADRSDGSGRRRRPWWRPA